jgi:GDP-L-fucose synthase
MTNSRDRIYIAHHESVLGAALQRQTASQAHEHVDVITAGATELDLRCAASVAAFFRQEQPTQVVLPLFDGASTSPDAGTRGSWSAVLMSGMNVAEQARRAGVQRLLVIGDGLAYPADVPSPTAEEDLLSGRFRPEFECEAVATVALIKLCESYTRDFGPSTGLSYRAILTATPFGQGYDPLTPAQRVIATMIVLLDGARESQAPRVVLPFAPEDRQEFLYVDDIAAAALYVLNVDSHVFARVTGSGGALLNAGYGIDISYGALAVSMASIVGYRGAIAWEPPPDCKPRPTHRLDSHRLRSIGWRPQLQMEDALALAYFHHRAQTLKTATA